VLLLLPSGRLICSGRAFVRVEEEKRAGRGRASPREDRRCGRSFETLAGRFEWEEAQGRAGEADECGRERVDKKRKRALAVASGRYFGTSTGKATWRQEKKRGARLRCRGRRKSKCEKLRLAEKKARNWRTRLAGACSWYGAMRIVQSVDTLRPSLDEEIPVLDERRREGYGFRCSALRYGAVQCPPQEFVMVGGARYGPGPRGGGDGGGEGTG
jgi:hypothetical protein